MKDVLVAIVQNIPAMLAAFGAVVRFGEDDDERLDALEKVVADLTAQISQINALLEAKRKQKGLNNG